METCFLRLVRSSALAPLTSCTRGVHQIVRFNEYPVPIRDELIDAIRVRLSDPLAREPYFKPGERVRIADGAFSQMEAIFVARDGPERVVLLLSILQTEQSLTFPLKSVRKLG